MPKEKIANRQLWFILFMMRSTIILASLPVLTSANALQDAWISALVTLVGSEVIVFLISLLSTKFPQLTVVQYSKKLLGSWGGNLLNLIYAWLFLQLAVVELRLYGEVIVGSFLTQTPLIFIAATMVLASIICIYKGVEVLGRMADFLFWIFIIMILLVTLIPIPNINIKNLQPVLVRGWQPVIKGSLTPIALIAQAWVLGMLTPVLTEPKKVIRTSLISIGISLTILVMLSVIIIGALGPHEAARSTFPLLALMRAVELSSFLQRTEVLVIFAWGFGLFVSVTTYLYCGAKSISDWLNLADYRPLVFPMAIIWIFMSIHGFENVFALNEFLSPGVLAPYYGFVFLFLPLILLWSGYIIRFFVNKIKGEQ